MNPTQYAAIRNREFVATSMYLHADNYDGAPDSGCDFQCRLLAARLAAILDPGFYEALQSWVSENECVPGERIDSVREAMELWREIPEGASDLHPLTEEAVRLVIAMHGLCEYGYDCESEGHDPEVMCEQHANEYAESQREAVEHNPFWGDR